MIAGATVPLSDRSLDRLDAALAARGLELVQVAYHVPDPAAAARELAAQHGYGPFYLIEHVPLSACRYRGRPAVFDHSSAYGQAGDRMVELICQHGEDPSVVRELFGSADRGVHHVASFVAELESSIAELEAHGWPEACRATTGDGVTFALVDARSELGCFLELYERSPALERFYAHVARAASHWDGRRPVRRIDLPEPVKTSEEPTV